ncbi:DUF1801 domain-containing protein [uncultured Flavobacterium sp.]|uniref:DUF1801 domain-containing protein n=1 Tax=uncultured Flavobacterium sp. TaxID=165435 RepID=UPI0030C7EC2A
MKTLNEIDLYIERFPKDVQVLLQQLRTIIKKAAPKTEEIMSYQMPAYKQNNRLVYFAGYKKHIGFYPHTSPISHFKDELKEYKTSKGAIQFPLDKPLPNELITRIVEFRVQEDLENKKMKKAISKKEAKVWNKTNQWTVELELLKTIINKTQLVETVKWGVPIYMHNDKNVIGIAGFKSYFGIWFYNGVFLKDEKNLLINANEENTKGLRQMRFNSINEVNEKTILQYIKEAIANEEKGLKIKPEKKAKISCELLENEFKSNINLKNAFNLFTPYKQREFMEYINDAKQEKTKITRLEKIKPMILSNIGLHDKYRS